MVDMVCHNICTYLVDMIANCIMCSMYCILLCLGSLIYLFIYFNLINTLSLFPSMQFTVDESDKYWVLGEAETTLPSRKVSNQQDSQDNLSDDSRYMHSVARMSDGTSQTSTCIGDTSLEGISTYTLPVCVHIMYVHSTHYPLFT